MTQLQQDSLSPFMAECRDRCDKAMASHLDSLTVMPETLVSAMRYSALLGGKRLRPCLVYASALATGQTIEYGDDAAAAIELLHCYSLIHDDLPAMDNDDLRRGQPTLHVAYDEATAILAGDAMQALAFQILSESSRYSESVRLRMLQCLTRAGGCHGMVAGQAIDLASVGQSIKLPALENMHRLKTGALIMASVELGALSAACVDESILSHLRGFAGCIGLAFQVQDDILDVTGDTATLGKQQGADQALNKPTYVSLLGLDEAKLKASRLIEDAHGHLDQIDGDTRYLAALADYITGRLY
ncbi:(2E,6E)-farnesyl diphosphate synthase [Pseudohongiella nitratireducens]|uniref:(2E,6E)-farnesyl diphosphate synthase n=1 Tax=Pseudohongiella nitratireducens TaxID=1768907 RepID=UPI0030EB86BC